MGTKGDRYLFYKPLGDDLGPVALEATSWATSFSPDVGIIDERRLFRAGDKERARGTVTATYQREGKPPLKDTVKIVAIIWVDYVIVEAIESEPPKDKDQCAYFLEAGQSMGFRAKGYWSGFNWIPRDGDDTRKGTKKGRKGTVLFF